MWILFILFFDDGGSSGRVQKLPLTQEFSSKITCENAVKQAVLRKKNSVYDAWCVQK